MSTTVRDLDDDAERAERLAEARAAHEAERAKAAAAQAFTPDPAIGLSRNKQLKAIGNGVVPPQAFAAMSLLMPIAEEVA